jgi:hypothetical protein
MFPIVGITGVLHACLIFRRNSVLLKISAAIGFGVLAVAATLALIYIRL